MRRAARCWCSMACRRAIPFGGWVNWPAYDPADLTEDPSRARRRKRRQRPGRARRDDRDDEPRRTPASRARSMAGAGESLEARGARRDRRGGRRRSAFRAAASASDGFVPITERHAGPADERAPYREWSGRGRWVAPVGGDDRAAGEPRRLSRLADARHRFQRRPHEWRRCVAAAGRARQLAMERARLLAMAQPDEQHRERERRAGERDARVAAGFGAVAWARRQRRAAAADAATGSSCGSAPTRGAPDGEIARALQLCRRRADAAAPAAARPGPAARSPKRAADPGALR